MAKSSRGGQRGTISRTVNVPRNTPAAAPQIDDTTQASSFENDYGDFLKLSEDQRINAIEEAIQEGVPAHLADNSLQRVIYNLEFNDTPDVVSDKQLDKMNGTELFRTVNKVYDSAKDINYTPKEIAEQIQMGSTTRVSDNGGSAYSRGIYFADRYSDSTDYGRKFNDINTTAVVRAKLNSNAKIITYSQASQGTQAEINSGSKLGKMLSKTDRESRYSIYALVKGYNVIDARNGYYVILNRRAMTMSKDIKAAQGGGW